MNKHRSILCAALALVLALLPLRMGVHAVVEDALIDTNGYLDNEELINDYDREKLTAFWNTVNEKGYTNGEAVFNCEYPDSWLDEIGGHEYLGTALTPLVKLNGYAPTAEDYSFNFLSWYELDHLVYTPGEEPEYARVYPELFGDLDLSGTSIRALQLTMNGNDSHISSINLDGCNKLQSIHLNGEYECTELSALDCPALGTIVLHYVGIKSLAVSPVEFSQPLYVNVFGAGSIGLDCVTYGYDPFLTAYPEANTFVGWFEDGELVSTELEYVRTEGGSLTAVFGGDADGDGAVTITDAVLTMRASMGIIQVANSGMLDVNGSEDIDIADALLIMRFAMGLIG